MNNGSFSQLICADQNSERGSSTIGFIFWLGLLGILFWNAALLFQPYYINWKVQDVFDAAADKMSGSREVEVRHRLPKLFKVMYLSEDDVPVQFFDNLKVNQIGPLFEIRSHYSVSVWPLGYVQDVNANGEYDPDQLTGVDEWRYKAAYELEFSPHAFSDKSK